MVKRFTILFFLSIVSGVVLGAQPLPVFAFLALSDGSLIKGSGSEVYFLENGMKRWIADEEAFNSFEFHWDRIKTVTDEELRNYPTGESMDFKSRYPDGALVRADRTRGGDGVKVYVVQNGVRRWIKTARDFENLGLDWHSVMDISPKKIKSVSEGKPLEQPAPLPRPLAILVKMPPKVVEDVTVKFEFTGVTGEQDNRVLTFQSFLEGVDANWVASGRERSITLPKKSGTYTFFVRARDQSGNVDKTPKSYTFDARISPYYGEVAITAANARATSPSAEYVTIQGRTNDSVAVTGWTLQSKRRRTDYRIPDGYEVPNQPNYEYKKDIAVNKKIRIVVYTGRSTSGLNFRLNKCIGYLSVYYAFTPPLPRQCPQADLEEMRDLNLSQSCQQAATKAAASCMEPNLNEFVSDVACRDYLKERFGYSQCVERNHAYFDFLSDEWRVYLNQPKEIWANDKDAIVLRDKDGLVVSTYRY